MQRKSVTPNGAYRPTFAAYAACRGLALYDAIEDNELLQSCDLVREAMHQHDMQAHRSAE